MDALVRIPHSVVESTLFLEARVPPEHPSAPTLGEERAGAAVAVAPDRVLTAHYLVVGARSIELSAADGQPRSVDRIELDHETGLALLRVEGPALRAAPFGESRSLRPGAPVFVLTFADADQRRGATGHVSSVGPFEAFWEYMLDRAITTTMINPGVAGAPLFDAAGGLLGVISLGLATVARYSLAIPLELYLERRGQLEQGERLDDRAWLGFYTHGSEGSLIVAGVVPGGPAESAGIERGDVVLSVDGEAVASLRELYNRIWLKHPGEAVGLQILRESSIRVVDVTSGDRYEFYR
jgi:S1-C subfamily serine protease